MDEDRKSRPADPGRLNEHEQQGSGSELESRLQRAMDAGRIFSWEVNPETRELEWSSNMEAVIGFSLFGDVDKTAEFVHPDDLGRLMTAVGEAAGTGGEFECEFRLINPESGEELWFYSQGALRRDTGDGRPRLSGITRDITRQKRAEEELVASHARTTEILESISDAFYAVDAEFNFTYVNKKAEELWGRKRESLIGKHFWTEFPMAVGSEVHNMHLRAMTERQAVHFETISPVLKRWIDVSIYPDDRGGLSCYFRDITARKRAEEALRESEVQSRLLIEGAIDFAIMRVTADGLIASWNTGAERVFGYADKEVIGRGIDILFTPEDQSNGVPTRELDAARAEGRAEDERWHVRRDGTRFFASGVMMRLGDGSKGFVKIARDRTEKLAAEKAERDREILQRMVGAQEEERKRLARDLHDELGQQLTALRWKLEQIKNSFEQNDELMAQIDDVRNLARSIDDGVDFLAWELRPSVLDDIGLFAALDNYVKEWAQRSGIKAEFITSNISGTRFPHEAETNLYRILQEALNNVHKHARASNVGVVLETRQDSIILIIDDDGVGFDPEKKKNLNKGMGLTGMEERATLVGGTLEVESARGKGTTIFVSVPLDYS